MKHLCLAADGGDDHCVYGKIYSSCKDHVQQTIGSNNKYDTMYMQQTYARGRQGKQQQV